MELLLAALQRVRNDLVHIHADFQRLETCVKNSQVDCAPSLAALRTHTRDLGRHVVDIMAYSILH